MQAYRLVCAWTAAGHEVIVAGRRMRGGSIRLDDGSMVRVLRISTWQQFGRTLRALTYAFSLASILIRHRNRVDLVYTRFLHEGAAVTALLKRWGVLRQPLVAVPANVRGSGDIHSLMSIPGSARIVRLLRRECNAINLIAGAMTDELTDAGFDPRRFIRIPNGIPVKPLRGKSPSSPPTFLTVGRLAPQKGLNVLIHALSRLGASLAPGQFRIAGDGPERRKLQAMARDMGVDHAITWLGELSPDAVAAELDSADIFLLPSLYEGMSNAGLEAMERGRAMLLTRCGGLDEFVSSRQGWVVEPGDIDALAQAISQALSADTETLALMGASNRSTVEDQFDMNLVAMRYLDLFRHLLDTRSEPNYGKA